ncbi:MAG: DUF4198 domain-containing protein [Gemmatimonadota bacterium]|nr:DUF4198 domain-containing protein [Gemmatimonadota bacterium]
MRIVPRPRIATLPLLAILLVASAATLAAHDTWLVPDSGFVVPHAMVRLHLTSGDAFPVDDFAIDRKRIRGAWMRLAGTRSPLAVEAPAERHLALTARADREGVATLWVALAPKSLELTDAKVTEYLDDIAATATVRRRWDAMPAPRRWRETYTKHAKSFVRVGEPAHDRTWATPVGLGLEIVPERDPTTVQTGDTIRVRVLSHGAPVAALPIGFQHEGDTATGMRTTSGDGRAWFVLGAAGRWLIKATDLRPSRRPNEEWQSDFTTLTIAVRAHGSAR